MIGSPGFLASEWCMNRELPEFLEATCSERIIVVEKIPFDRNYLPKQVQNRLAKRFWAEDPVKGEWETFGDPVSTSLSDKNFQRELNRLSQEMANLLQSLKNEPVSSSTTTFHNRSEPNIMVTQPHDAPAVYLAEASEDLEKDRDSVRSYLIQQNVLVFTAERFPAAPDEYRSELKKILHRDGIIFAQLLSGLPGRRLAEGDDESRCIRIQFEVAKGQHVPLYQWRSRSLNIDGITDMNHRALIAGESVQVSSLEEFKALLVERAKSPSVRVVVSCDDQRDDELGRQALAIAREISFSADFAGVSDSTDRLESKLRDCEALIFVHGLVPPEILRKHFQECSSVIRRRLRPTPKRAILLGPPPKEPLRFDFIKVDWINCQNRFDPEKIRDFFEFLPRREE
jgi:hypothetical protein